MEVRSHLLRRLNVAYLQTAEKNFELKTRKIMSLTGTILSGNHTFAVAKVPHANHQRIFEALYSNQNEFNQVIAYYMTMSRSIGELKDELKTVADRYPEGTGPELFYTDSCC